jgi:acetylornithine aminotransferase
MPKSYLMPVFSPLPVAFERGEGAWLWDTEGRKYLDALSGVAVSGLGHAHPAVTEAIARQAAKLIHASNWYHIPEQEQLGETLCKMAGMENAFFCNSGAEANEAAIKLARLHGSQRKILNPSIIVMDGSFHGRTLATLTASGNRKIQAGFEPLVKGFNRVPFNDLDAVRQVGDNNSEVVAILVEPIQGEGGISLPSPGYLEGLRRICDERGWLLMFDEIQTGMCRTGKWFAWQHENAAPDVMTLAKGLGNGVPIGACLARGAAARVFQPGNHGSTFGGNPLVCSVALTVIDVLKREKMEKRAAHLGARLLAGLQSHLQGVAGVKDIRGKGLMLAVELDRPCKDIMGMALAQGLLLNVTADKIVRLLPPLILSDDEADRIAGGVATVVREYLERPVAA